MAKYPRYEDIPSENNIRVIFWGKNKFHITDPEGYPATPTMDRKEWELVKACIDRELTNDST